MFNWFLKLITSIASLWSTMPEATKEKIIDTIVDTFEVIFRKYFRSEKPTSGEKSA
jgi:hypothetical protein